MKDIFMRERVFKEFYLMLPEKLMAPLRETNSDIADEEIAKALECS